MEQRMGDKKQRRETGNKGREDREQKEGNNEQRSETGNRGWETRNRDMRHGTVDGRRGTKK
jgi:hypothetical protein